MLALTYCVWPPALPAVRRIRRDPLFLDLFAKLSGK